MKLLSVFDSELWTAQNSPKLVESPKLNKKRKKEMPELKRLNVPTEYNSNENLQAIPSPIKTLQDVSYELSWLELFTRILTFAF